MGLRSETRRRPARRPRLPGAVELPWARRRRLRAERGTVALGIAAFGLTAAVLGGEVARMLRDRIHEHPELDPLETADVPARKVVMGVPARLVREVPDEDLLERWG